MNQPEGLGRVIDRVQLLSRRRGLPISQAVDEILPNLKLEPEVREFFVRCGIVSYINDANHYERIEIVSHANLRVPAKAGSFVNLTIRHVGADSRPRQLLDFTVADWAAFEETAKAQAHAWLQRAMVAKEARTALAEEGKTLTRDLSAEALRSLEEAIGEAW